MLKRDDVIEGLTILAGHAGRFMVFIGMLAGCILLWYFVLALIKAGI